MSFLKLPLLWAICLSAQIIEVKQFADVCPYAKEDVLLVLDIDDTLLIPVQMLGCDEWFGQRKQKYLEEGLDKRQALEKTLAEWLAIRHLTQMEIVEPGSEETLRALQAQGVRVMGLTTQDMALAARTSLHLQEQGIDLKKTAPHQRGLYFEQGAHGVLYRNGVLFTSGAHKGEALFSLLDHIGYHPSQIVFLNDKASHLREVEEIAEKREAPFVGLRYGYSDARKEAFRLDVAEHQFHYSSFAKLLSDAEAMAQIEK
jgi:hypothetical protein